MDPREINLVNLNKYVVEQANKLAKSETRKRVRRRSSVKVEGEKSIKPPEPEPPYRDIADILDTAVDAGEFS